MTAVVFVAVVLTVALALAGGVIWASRSRLEPARQYEGRHRR